MNVKYYKLKLKVLSPVHIGSNEQIGKREYVYNKQKQQICIFNSKKMFSSLLSKGLAKKYELYLTSNPKGVTLEKFLNNNGITESDYMKWVDYFLFCPINDKRSLQNIYSFIKDSYGCPYIPGSSIKGALRTVILKQYLFKNSKDFTDISKGNLNNYTEKNIQQIAFNRLRKNKNLSDATNDTFRGLIISDSKPLSTNDLIICKKLDIKEDLSKKTPNVYRECLRPGTLVEFDVSIDLDIFPFDINYINQAIKEIFTDYNDLFLSAFDCDVDLPIDENVIILGGGPGFISKSVMYDLYDFDKAFEETKKLLSNKFKKHKHFNDREISPATRKCTEFNGKMFDFGLCKIDFTPIGWLKAFDKGLTDAM